MRFEIHRYNERKYGYGKTEYIKVCTNLRFDYEEVFCGKPYIYLIATKDNPGVVREKYEIMVMIADNDDYSIGYKYKPTEEQFFDVLHELINWMHDLEMGLCLYDDYVDKLESGEFFPVLNCKRMEW